MDMKKNKIPTPYRSLDQIAKNGAFTEGKNLYPKLDMKAIRKFCKEERREYSSLTDKELARFSMS